jgi:transketolase C-terminal domain/subunit
VGVPDSFGESGSPEEVFARFGLTAEGVASAAVRAVSRASR